jgi:hypothetical protein
VTGRPPTAPPGLQESGPLEQPDAWYCTQTACRRNAPTHGDRDPKFEARTHTRATGHRTVVRRTTVWTFEPNG